MNLRHSVRFEEHYRFLNQILGVQRILNRAAEEGDDEIKHEAIELAYSRLIEAEGDVTLPSGLRQMFQELTRRPRRGNNENNLETLIHQIWDFSHELERWISDDSYHGDSDRELARENEEYIFDTYLRNASFASLLASVEVIAFGGVVVIAAIYFGSRLFLTAPLDQQPLGIGLAALLGLVITMTAFDMYVAVRRYRK